MKTRYIKREEITVTIDRLPNKHKGIYRFEAKASAPLYYEECSDEQRGNTWNYIGSPILYPNHFSGNSVYSKTRKGAETSALLALYHKCRPPLPKILKLENRSTKFKKKHKRTVYVEVRVSNALDFIVNDDCKNRCWHDIRKEI